MVIRKVLLLGLLLAVSLLALSLNYPGDDGKHMKNVPHDLVIDLPAAVDSNPDAVLKSALPSDALQSKQIALAHKDSLNTEARKLENLAASQLALQRSCDGIQV